jgi:hypothetical protein
VLEVVENEEQLAVAQQEGEPLQRKVGPGFPPAECLIDERRDEFGVVDRGERHERHAVGKPAPFVGRGTDREAGLAHAARPGQGQQPHVVA